MTKDELLAANERLGAEVAAHRVLLAAIRQLATVPKPADWTSVDYVFSLESRLITLGAYAGHVDDVHPDIMVRALHNRASALREEAAKGVKYALAEPVITDSGRTCGQANPGTGAWCHRDGDHGEHRDTDGEKWRTDATVEFTSDSRLTSARCHQPGEHHANLTGAVVDCDRPEHHKVASEAADIAYDRTHPDPYRNWVNGEQPASVTGDEDRCECSHQEPEHGYYAIGTAPAAARECRHPGCGCGRYRLAAPRPHTEPPAVVNGDVVLEVRALLS